MRHADRTMLRQQTECVLEPFREKELNLNDDGQQAILLLDFNSEHKMYTL